MGRSKASKRSLDPPAKNKIGFPVMSFKFEFPSDFEDFLKLHYSKKLAESWPRVIMDPIMMLNVHFDVQRVGQKSYPYTFVNLAKVEQAFVSKMQI